jgi:DNA helicase-2/ATP-dependent DNA helicase PcrA
MTSSANSNEKLTIDAEQRAAVEAKEAAIAVLAGPGSGKTRTLSFRARHLLFHDKDASALLLTFTNKAAAEMKSRALDVAGVPSRRLAASTFHTFCANVLRAHGDLVGLSRDFEILDGREARQLATDIVSSNSMPASLAVRFRDVRLRRGRGSEELKKFGELYQAAKKKAAAVDFDYLVVAVADLFDNRQDIVQAYAGRFRHILVDEFQDTNAVQAVIVRRLAAYARTVSIFADDDQAIFGFAGAEEANIQRFVETSDARVYPLTVNYRSRSNIVAVANSLIAASPSSSGRRMRAHRTGGSVELRAYETTEREADDIGAEISGMVSGGAGTADIAVLARSGWRADLILEDLQKRGIPVSDWRGETHTPEDRRLLAACLAAVRGTLNARQVEVLSAVMRVEPSGAMDTEAFISKYANTPLAIGLSTMRDLVFNGASPHQVARAAQNAVAAQNAQGGASLNSIVESVAHFELYDKDFSLEHLLSELALGSIGRGPTTGGGVKIASLHRTKGLQWKVVYLVGLEEGHHPDRRCVEDKDLFEERRLCFVGVSRAEERLVATWSRMSSGYPRQQSRFLAEMGFKH